MSCHRIEIGGLLLILGLIHTPWMLAQPLQIQLETPSDGIADVESLNQKVLELYQQGQYEIAIPLAQKVLRLRRQFLDKKSPQIAKALRNLAILYHSQRRYSEAEPLHKEALDIAQKILPENHLHLGIYVNNLAELYSDQGRYSEAEPLHKKALDIARKALPANHPKLSLFFTNLATLYRISGRYSEAETLFKKAFEIDRKALHKNHPHLAQSFSNLALLYNLQGRYSEAEPLHREALNIARKALPENHPHFGRYLNNLALLYSYQGRYNEAEPLYKQALKIVQGTLPENHPNLAFPLNNLATLYRVQGRYSEAEPLYKQALDIIRKSLSEDHPQLAAYLTNLAQLYESQRRYSEAEPLYKQALVVTQKNLSENHPELAIHLSSLAALYKSQGRYSEAEPLYKQALSIARKSLPESHPHLVQYLSSLAKLYKSMGHYSEVEILYKQALDITQKALRQNHPHLVHHLNNLARLYESLGRYGEAEILYEQALDIIHKALPKNHSTLATSLNNLAGLYASQGRYNEAETLYKKALNIDLKSPVKDYSNIAATLNNLAEIYYISGHHREAETLHRQALRTVQKGLPENHLQLATYLNNLASIYESQERYSEAETLYKEALDIVRKALSEDHPILALPLNNLASLYRVQGRYSEAEILHKKALNIDRKSLPENHPQLAAHLKNLAVFYWAQNSISKTLITLEEGLNIEENNLATNLDFGAEAQKRNFLALFSGSTGQAISFQQKFAPKNPEAQNLALNTILRRKGRLLDVQSQTLNRLRQNTSQIIRTQLEQLAQLQTKLSILANKGPQTSKSEDYLHHRQALEQTITKLETQLSRASAELRLQFNSITVPQVQAHIPKDAILIEFSLYQPFNPKAPKQKQWQPARYAVYVLTPKGQIQWADLGPVDELDPIIRRFRAYVANPNRGSNRMRAFSQKLYDKLFLPIQSHLSSAQHLLIAPDGPLNLIPFEALADQQKQYLIETYQITYLSSGRDLLRLQGSTPNTQGPLLIANPAYNQHPNNDALIRSTEDTFNTALANFQTTSQRSKDFRGSFFTPLPITLEEGKALKKLLKNSRLLTGANATETALKNSPAPNVLHIATHGIFLKDQILPKANTSDIVRQQFENPLLRSWLAFAGANHPHTSPDDGILTAFEVSRLNLQGTQLVTLSACQTGEGEVVNGEGVYGLRRAFTLAGAKSQLMSLWDVQDESTKDLMVAYYTRLQAGEGRGSALRAVQLQMLKGEIKDSEGNTYDHPYYWAAFVRTGDWRPIDLQ